MPASADTSFDELSPLPPPHPATVSVDIRSRTAGRTPRRRGRTPILGSLSETGQPVRSVLAGQRADWLRFHGSYQTELVSARTVHVTLDGMTFVITGGAQGIGAATARAAAGRGASVVV